MAGTHGFPITSRVTREAGRQEAERHRRCERQRKLRDTGSGDEQEGNRHIRQMYTRRDISKLASGDKTQIAIFSLVFLQIFY